MPGGWKQMLSGQSRGIKAVIAALGFIALAFLSWVLNLLFDFGKETTTPPPPNKYIAVIMSKTDPTFTIPTEFLSGFGNKEFLETDSKRKIDIEYLEDLYDKKQAESVAKTVASDDNCVLVIGNSNSELTGVTLDVLLQNDDPPAFILPIATATTLLAKAKAANYHGVLRMVPDNENQADEIKSFVAKLTTEQRVGILVDEDNRLYSHDLSRNIAAKIRKNGGSIVLMKDYGSSSRLIDNLNTLENNSALPELLVFVGISSNGLQLIDELAAFGHTFPVIFTDGCLVEELVTRAGMLKQAVYVLSAVSVKGDSLPTYEPIGKDAYSLAEKIVAGAREVTRDSIRERVWKDRDDIVIQGGNAGNYQFDEVGNNVKMNFLIYRIRDAKLTLEVGY